MRDAGGITAVFTPPFPLPPIRYSQIAVFLYPQPRDPLSPLVAGVDSCDIRSRALFPRPSAGTACRPTVQRASSWVAYQSGECVIGGDGEGGGSGYITGMRGDPLVNRIFLGSGLIAISGLLIDHLVAQPQLAAAAQYETVVDKLNTLQTDDSVARGFPSFVNWGEAGA